MKTAVYPGSFNPPTLAHLAIAEAAVHAHHLDRVDLAQSHRPLGKNTVERPTFEHRVAVLQSMADARPWLGLLVTTKQLIAEIAEGYDMVIMGADKWAQIQDPAWYGNDVRRRDATLSTLPSVTIAPRPPHPVPPELALPVPLATIEGISSTAARVSAQDRDVSLMAPEARAFAETTGAWIDGERYEQFIAQASTSANGP